MTTPEGQSLLDAVALISAPGPADLDRWRRLADAERVSAALRLATGRRKGAGKFLRADRMWLTPVGVEQATAEAVARHKAGRFAGDRPVVDLCCGIGGDSLAIAGVVPGAIAVDRDPAMGLRAGWNASAYGVSDRLLAVQSSAEGFAMPDRALVHIDPDRRAGSPRRARSVVDYAPGLPFLNGLVESGLGAAIKLGPASDFDDHFGRSDVEVEIISLDGECKEATVWSGPLKSCQRRATSLPSGASWTDRDGPAGESIPITGPLPWLLEPDPALVRSGLLEGFAAVHGLGRLAAGIDVLVANQPVDSPFLTPFSVREILPLDRKQLARYVAEHGLGPLEIKTRGLDFTPEQARSWLKPPGPNPATLWLIGGRGKAQALVSSRGPRSRV